MLLKTAFIHSGCNLPNTRQYFVLKIVDIKSDYSINCCHIYEKGVVNVTFGNMIHPIGPLLWG